MVATAIWLQPVVQDGASLSMVVDEEVVSRRGMLADGKCPGPVVCSAGQWFHYLTTSAPAKWSVGRCQLATGRSRDLQNAAETQQAATDRQRQRSERRQTPAR